MLPYSWAAFVGIFACGNRNGVGLFRQPGEHRRDITKRSQLRNKAAGWYSSHGLQGRMLVFRCCYINGSEENMKTGALVESDLRGFC